MEKVFVICLVFIILSTGVLSQEEPSVAFTELECDDLGVLSLKAEYEWTGYKGGYVYLKSVKVETIKDGETATLEGYWRKFKTETFPQSEIRLNSPTAYFFSNKNALKEGTYNIEIDYAVSKSNIEHFKKKFKSSVICPKQKEVIKEVEPEPKEKKEEPKEELIIIPEEPSLLSEETEGYILYYVIGLLIVIFIVSLALMKKLPKKHRKESKPSSKKVANLFEKKSF